MSKPSVSFKVNINQAVDKLMKKLQGYEGHIGVLSSTKNKERESGDPLNNAELAAVHEFGTFAENIPARSFFRLTEKMKGKEMSRFILGQRDNIMKCIENGQIKLIIEKLSIKWESLIHECFETEGWGTWRPLRPATLIAREKKRHKKNQGGVMILQDTGAMERSIIFEAVKCSQK